MKVDPFVLACMAGAFAVFIFGLIVAMHMPELTGAPFLGEAANRIRYHAGV